MSSNLTTDVAIVGGGLAGASVAYALGTRGIRSIIVERKSALAQGASGNRYGLLMPYISASASPAESLYRAGFTHTKSLLTEALYNEGVFTQSGGLQLPSSARLRRLLQGSDELRSSDLIQRVTALQASEIANSPLTEGAFYVAHGGYVSPPALVSALVARHAPRTSAICNAGVVSIDSKKDAWSLSLTDGTALSASKVVICSAFEAASLNVCSWLPLEPIRGQTVIVKSSTASENLRTLLCFDGYITPAHGGEHFIGAIYRHGDLSQEASCQDSLTITKRLHRALPQLALDAHEESSLTCSLISARACFRTSTFDRLPYIGALPDFHTMSESARRYQSGTDLTQRIPLSFHPGIFVSLGHGSRGLLSCPLAGEMIARTINGEEQNALHEAARVTAAERYVYRALSAAKAS